MSESLDLALALVRRYDERTWLPFLTDIDRAWFISPGARAMLRGARLRLMMTAVAP